jgi:N-acetylneuraminic acid mutarotase
VELYDPATGIWTETAAMTDARAGHPAVLLHNGMVLVAGGGVTVGLGVDIGLSYCELYDPAAGTWTPTGSMATNREGHEGMLLDDGTVLVTGGALGEGDPSNLIDDRSLGSAELYDPGAGAWTAVPEMEANRAWHRAILLSNGKVLVVGGTNPDDTPQVGLDAAEIYDPVTKTWSPAGRMDLARYFFAAAHLPNGQVLVAGGVVETGSTLPSVISNTAELFSP